MRISRIRLDGRETAPAAPPEAVERVARRGRGDDLSIDMNWQPARAEGTTRSACQRSQQEETLHCALNLLCRPGTEQPQDIVAEEDSGHQQRSQNQKTPPIRNHKIKHNYREKRWKEQRYLKPTTRNIWTRRQRMRENWRT